MTEDQLVVWITVTYILHFGKLLATKQVKDIVSGTTYLTLGSNLMLPCVHTKLTLQFASLPTAPLVLSASF